MLRKTIVSCLQDRCKDIKCIVPLCLSSEQETSEESSEDNEEEDNEEKEVRPESLSPEELEKLKEAVDERKKLIQGLRGKPWPMKKKLVTLRYFTFL